MNERTLIFIGRGTMRDLNVLLPLCRGLSRLKGMAGYLRETSPDLWDLEAIGVERGFRTEVRRLEELLAVEGVGSDVEGHLKQVLRKIEQHRWNASFGVELQITEQIAYDAGVMLLVTRGKCLHSSSGWSDEKLGLNIEFLKKLARWLSDCTAVKESIVRLGGKLERLAAATFYEEGFDCGAVWDFFVDAADLLGLLDAFAEFNIPTGTEAGLSLIEKIEFHQEIWGDLGPDLIAQRLNGETEVPVQDSLVSRLFGSCRR